MGVEAARRALANGDAAGLGLLRHHRARLPRQDQRDARSTPRSTSATRASPSTWRARRAARSARCAPPRRRGGLAVLSDVRTGRPGSADERDGGDGAAAFLLRRRRRRDRRGRRRGLGDRRVPRPLARARRAGQRPVGGALRPGGLPAADRATPARARSPRPASSSADHVDRLLAARARRRGRGQGASPARVAEAPPPIGYAGAADPGVRLAAVLDRAEPGETILLRRRRRRLRRDRAARRPTRSRAAAPPTPVADQVDARPRRAATPPT